MAPLLARHRMSATPRWRRAAAGALRAQPLPATAQHSPCAVNLVLRRQRQQLSTPWRHDVPRRGQRARRALNHQRHNPQVLPFARALCPVSREQIGHGLKRPERARLGCGLAASRRRGPHPSADGWRRERRCRRRPHRSAAVWRSPPAVTAATPFRAHRCRRKRTCGRRGRSGAR